MRRKYADDEYPPKSTFLIFFLSHFAPVSYNRDSDQLTKWLESSQQTLNYWKEQSLNLSQDLDTIRSNINNFFVSYNRIYSDNYCQKYQGEMTMVNSNSAHNHLWVRDKTWANSRAICLYWSFIYLE